MSNERKHRTSEERVALLRRHLIDNGCVFRRPNRTGNGARLG